MKQDFKLEQFAVVNDHSQIEKVPTTTNGYDSKDCINSPSSTAVFRSIAFSLEDLQSPYMSFANRSYRHRMAVLP